MLNECQARMRKRGIYALCMLFFGGGDLVRAATFRTEGERNNKKKLKTCIYKTSRSQWA